MSQNNTNTRPILVTGAGGQVGGVSTIVVDILRKQNLPVRAMVRRDDERAEALRKKGVEVVVGDLTVLADVHRVIEGCSRVYFTFPVGAAYLEASLLFTAVAKHHGVEVLVNMSQLTVSLMSIDKTVSSPQAKAHWLSEQAMLWSGLPVVNIRPTIFLENPYFRQWAQASIRRNNELRIPLGDAHVNPIAAHDVARVVAAVLAHPAPHVHKNYMLVGPALQSMEEVAGEYSKGLGRAIKYVPVELGVWKGEMQKEVDEGRLEQHVADHLFSLASLLQTKGRQVVVDDVVKVTGEPAMGIAKWVQERAAEFAVPAQ